MSAPRNKLKGRKKEVTDKPVVEDEGKPGGIELGMEWLCVLWQRAMEHPNTQAREACFVMVLSSVWWLHCAS